MNEAEKRKYIGNEELTLVEAMQKIDSNSRGILYIADKDNRLLGAVTDGDIRRWIIKTGRLTGTAGEMMNRNPKYCFINEEDFCEGRMTKYDIPSVPVINESRQIVRIAFRKEKQKCLAKADEKALANIPIIVMAGGKGSRLYPYTKILPKPLIPIGDVPILERILNRFYQYGAETFFLTVNYKKEMIKSYFAEAALPYRIHYIEENKPLGTAGSIRLIQEKFVHPVIVTNCDILIQADYQKIMEYHVSCGNHMTIISALKNISIPYGVLHLKEEGLITSLQEKPQLSCFVNTGMYIINPEYLKWIPENSIFHMTDLAERMISKKKQVGMYPVSEQAFLDMGEFEEMRKMEERIREQEAE